MKTNPEPTREGLAKVDELAKTAWLFRQFHVSVSKPCQAAGLFAWDCIAEFSHRADAELFAKAYQRAHRKKRVHKTPPAKTRNLP